MQLSTDVKAFKILFYSDKGMPTKSINISEKQKDFVLGALNHYKESGVSVPITIDDTTFAVSNVKMIEKTKDQSKINAAYKHSQEVLKGMETETVVQGIEESRRWAKQRGKDNKAWECDICNLWSPYLVVSNPENGSPMADFTCKHCGK